MSWHACLALQVLKEIVGYISQLMACILRRFERQQSINSVSGSPLCEPELGLHLNNTSQTCTLHLAPGKSETGQTALNDAVMRCGTAPWCCRVTISVLCQAVWPHRAVTHLRLGTGAR